jgi:hypothetical protein
MDIQLFTDVITGNKPIDILPDVELAKVTHDVDIVWTMLMDELDRRFPKFDDDTKAQISGVLFDMMNHY